MKHFGTDIIRKMNLYQSEGSRRFCHASHTILCPVNGEIHITIDSRTDTFDDQGVLLIPCGKDTRLLCSKPSSYLVLQLSPAFLMEAFSRERLLSGVISSQDISQLREILPDLFALVPLFLESPDQNRLEINRLLFTILCTLDRILEPSAAYADNTGADLLPRQKSVDSYIAANIEKQISLQETAVTCGLTPQYLSSFFQKSMNCTFMEYINRIKAEKAYEWFLHSDLSSEDVCDIAGFKTYSAFCKSIQNKYDSSWDMLREKQAVPCISLPDEDNVSNPLSRLYIASKTAQDSDTPPEHILHIRKETIVAETTSERTFPDSWRTILNVGSADSLFFEPFLKKLDEFNRMISFRYCRMYGLLQLITSYVSGGRTYYGFELVFQNLDYIINAGLIPFLDIGFRDFPGHSTPVSSFVFDSDPIDIYYDKLLLVLPEFLRAASNRYGHDIVGKWVLEFHFSYQNNRNYTFWQFLSSFKKIEETARQVHPDVCIGGLGFDAALHPDTLQSMLEQLKSLECRMDFISIHVNGLILPKINGSGQFMYSDDENEVDRRVQTAAALIRHYYPQQSLYITEFGFAHFLKSALNDSLFQASFILRFLIKHSSLVEGIGYHMMDDLGDHDRPADKEFFGCAGLYSTHGLRKPSYYAYSFLSHLGKSVLSVSENHILTARSRFSYQLLAYRYQHIPASLKNLHQEKDVLAFEQSCADDGGRLQLHFRIHGASPGQYMIKALRMIPESGNLYKLRLYQSTILNVLNEADYVFYRVYSLPEVRTEPCIVPSSGELTIDVMLAPMETVLLLIDYCTI